MNNVSTYRLLNRQVQRDGEEMLVPNELLEKMYSTKMPGSCYRIMWTLLRRSWITGSSEIVISLGEVAAHACITDRGASKSIGLLVQHGFIERMGE